MDFGLGSLEMFQCGGVTLVPCSLASRSPGRAGDIQGVVGSARTSARPVTHLGGRILKFLFHLGLEGGAASTGWFPMVGSGSGWYVYEWRVIVCETQDGNGD